MDVPRYRQCHRQERLLPMEPQVCSAWKKGGFLFIVWHIQRRVGITGSANPSMCKPVPVLRGRHEKIAN